ncbi:MAG: cytochrome c biogenesis protein CcsA [Chitinophagales bacterium]
MLKIFKQNWWKLLAVLLLLFSVSAALLIPLSSGIQNISPQNITTGSTHHVEVYGYNSHFKSADPSLILVLKNDQFQFCSEEIEVKSPHHFIATIKIPANIELPKGGDFFNAIVNNNEDGSSLMRRAIRIEQKSQLDTLTVAKKNFCNRQVELKLPAHLTFPYREILYETIRNLFLHVPMWFAMTLLLLVSFVSSIKFLSTGALRWDLLAKNTAFTALFFGFLGIFTGMVWANFTWGAPWVNDPKLNGAAVGILIYLAYFVLRGSVRNPLIQRKVASVYNIFSFVLFIVFIFVLPRMTDSLHPGSGGNPGFNTYDLDNTMRPVFYTAILGFFLLGLWLSSLLLRLDLIEDKQNENE